MQKLNPYVWSGMIIATIQLLMAIYIAAYHSVHMKAKVDQENEEDDEDKTEAQQTEKMYYKVFQRKYIKSLMRAMIFEGILLEISIVIITSIIQKEIDVTLTKCTSNWMFIINVLASLVEIIATCGDIAIVWFEYDGQSSIIEKNLELKHVLVRGSDRDYVFTDFKVESKLEDIAKSIKKKLVEMKGEMDRAMSKLPKIKKQNTDKS